MRVIIVALSSIALAFVCSASAFTQGQPQAFAYEATNGAEIFQFDDPQSSVAEKVPPKTIVYSFRGQLPNSPYVEIDSADGGMIGYALVSSLKPLGKKTVALPTESNDSCRHC
jgi:hypothetical protein